MGVETLLTVGGAFFGAGTGGAGATAALVAAGSMVAERLLADPLQGPRLQAQMIQTASEGTPIGKGFGTWRQGVSILYTKIHEHRHTESAGGGGSGAQDIETSSYTLDAVLLGGEGPIDRLNFIQFDNNKIWSYDGTNQRSDPAGITLTFDADHGSSATLRIYYGTETQPADSIYEAIYGVGNAPRLLGRWYIVIEGYDITQYQGQLPAITVEPYNSTVALGDIVKYLVSKSDRAAADVDVTGLAGLAVAEWTIPTRTTAMACLQELMDLYQFDMPEINGVWTCLRRDRAASRTVSLRHLRWHEPGEAVPDVAVTLKSSRELPRSLEFNFFDTGRRHATGMRRVSIQGARSTGMRSATFNWGGTGPQADQIAQFMLSEEWTAGKKSFTATLGIRDFDVAAGDVLTIITPLGARDVIVDEIHTPLFGIQTATFLNHDRGAYAAPLGSDTSGVGQSSVTSYNGFFFTFLDTSAIYDELTAQMGFYIAATAPEAMGWRQVNWANGYFPSGIGLGRFLGNHVETRAPATMGTVTAVTNHVVDPTVVDWDNSYQIDLVRGALYSKSIEELMTGQNALFLGKEVVQFLNATYVGEIAVPGETYTLHRYVITGLLRGRRGTEYWLDQGHTEGEAAVFVNGALAFAPLATAALLQDLTITALAPDGTAVSENFTPEGRSMTPWTVAYITAERDIDGNISATYKRRSKLTDMSLDTGVEAPDAYGDLAVCNIAILNGVGTVVRSLTSSTDSFEYSAADQTADFGSPQAAVDVRIYQQNSIVGAGYPETATI